MWCEGHSQPYLGLVERNHLNDKPSERAFSKADTMSLGGLPVLCELSLFLTT